MPGSPPLVSVITATYDWSAVLRHAIRSVRGQTCGDFEMIVVGDACTDDSAEVVASFGDARLRWDNRAENSGSQSAPNNRGLELARGEFVAYLGHDDLWHPRHLEVLLAAVRAADADLAWTWTAQIGPPGSGVRDLRGVSADGSSLPRNPPPPSSILHRRALVDTIGGWKDFRTLVCGPDDDFLERAGQAARRRVAVPELTVWKFPSAWRPRSYVEKPSAEQAEMLRRMAEEPDFLAREALALAEALALGRTRPDNAIRAPRPVTELPRGWWVEQARRIRGLPPMELPEAPPPPAPPPRPNRAAELVRRVLRGVLRRLGPH